MIIPRPTSKNNVYLRISNGTNDLYLDRDADLQTREKMKVKYGFDGGRFRAVYVSKDQKVNTGRLVATGKVEYESTRAD
jgi:hypothetical protein